MNVSEPARVEAPPCAPRHGPAIGLTRQHPSEDFLTAGDTYCYWSVTQRWTYVVWTRDHDGRWWTPDRMMYATDDYVLEQERARAARSLDSHI